MKNVIRFLKDNSYYLPFLLFLKRNGCADSFFNNLAFERGLRLSGEAKDKHIIRYLTYTPKTCFISYAFVFIYTREGSAYWRLINQKWIDNLSRYKKQIK